MNFRTVGVIGVGNIGTSVVADLVLHGIHAIAVDLDEQHVVSRSVQLGRDEGPDLAAAGDDYPHQCPPVRVALARCSSNASMASPLTPA